ncbi:MAG: MATE family efflux transporter [Deferribacteres bacterium]|nr:MATE family efflux transporter [candidate division KSB1 bacterium]MCB9503043.1 MATE family efflux transporter [Deferribacteres bacterium]
MFYSNEIDQSLKREIKFYWRSIIDAVKGIEIDYTNANLNQAILLLAIPMVLEMAMESVFVLVDVFWVARIGTNAVAAVGLTDAAVSLIYAVSHGLAMAVSAVVARRIGEKDKAGANRSAAQAIWLGVFASIPGFFIGIFMPEKILLLMGASPEVIQIGSGFTIWLLGGNLVIILLFLNNGIFRGVGDATIAMRALWIANGFNILLDPCLIFGIGPFPELGVTGAAVATTFGRGVGVLYQFYVFWRGKSRVHIHIRDWYIQFGVIGNLIKVSGGGVLQLLIGTSSWIILMRIVADFGSSALAGYTIAIRIIVFTLLPAWGIANAASTLVGQNLGAKQADRAETAVWRTGLYNCIFLISVGFFFIFFPRPIVQFFTEDEAVITYAIDALRYISYGYAFYAYGMVLVQAFNGAGDTYTPTWLNFFCYWLFQIPLAYSLAKWLAFGAQGVFLSITITEFMLTVASFIIFRKGRWKLKQV